MFDIKQISAFLAYTRAMYVSKRPWAHFSKKGPGRKHQQGQALSKGERNEAKS